MKELIRRKKMEFQNVIEGEWYDEKTKGLKSVLRITFLW